MSDEFDPSGEIPKDRKAEGIELVTKNNKAWMARALWLADTYLPHGEVMGEDFQKLPDVGKPTSQHAWGALVQNAKRHHIILGTGRYIKSTRILNNAHKYEIYWRDGYPKRKAEDVVARPSDPSRTGNGRMETPKDGPPNSLPLFRFYDQNW